MESRRFVVLLLIAAMPLLCRAQEQYKSVETADLLKSPQKYWARAIVFKDTLTEAPDDARVDIEGKRYAEFSTRDVGACYASSDLLPAMSRLEVDREYLFSGTVFQHRGRYVPVIQSYTPAMSAQKLSADIRTVAEEKPDSFTNESVRPMADLLAAVQGAQVAYAKEKKIPLCQLYDPTSEHFIKAMDIARTAIYNSEQKNNTASAEILAQYLSTVLARQCAPGSATQAVVAAEPAPEAEDSSAHVEEPPAPADTNIAPAKLSWSERRALARAKKAAALKEKQEREAAKAAEKAMTEYLDQQKRINETAEAGAETSSQTDIQPQDSPEETAPATGETELKTEPEPDAAQAAEAAARKAASDYEARQKEPGADSEPTAPSESAIQETPEEAPPATNDAAAAESSTRKPAAPSWFQRWKTERAKRALIDAELRRIEQEKKDAAQRLAEEKKAEERRQAEIREAEEQKRSEEKKAEILKKKQDAEREKAEAEKARDESEENAEAAPARSSPRSSGNGIYAPVGR